MVKIVQDKQDKIKLQKGNKIIERTILEYKTNKAVWDFRGFKPVQDVVKEVLKEKFTVVFEGDLGQNNKLLLRKEILKEFCNFFVFGNFVHFVLLF